MIRSVSGLSLRLDHLEMIGLREVDPPCDEQDRYARTKPEQAPPAVSCGWNKGAVEHGCEEVADGVALLEDA